MTDIIVGSRAFKMHGIVLRDVQDIDLIVQEQPKYQSTTHKVDFLINQKLYNLLLPHTHQVQGTVLRLPTLEALYLLKLSHMNQNHNWYKHYYDVMRIAPQIPKNINIGLFEQLYGFWEEFFPLKPISLDKPPEEFFNQTEPEKHEELHSWFKLGEIPAYQNFLDTSCNGNGVKIDSNKFVNCSSEIKLNSFWEEAMVIATERKLTLIKGAQKVLCDLSKGTWNKYMVLNFYEIFSHFPRMKDFYQNRFNQLMEMSHEKLVN